MEVVAGGGTGGPFSRRNVQEWSRLDQLTGLLEHARVETDHWTASTSNSQHHFGKVVDSRSRNLADGGQEQRQQTKQLEVFQANIPGGSLQVIRSSTSSSWQSHKTLSGGSGWVNERLTLPSLDNQDFDHLKLTLNPLDLSSQKTRASVGRSGSISSRRPPSRPRSIVGSKPEEVTELIENRRSTDLSTICQKVHEEAKQELERSSPLSNGFSCDLNDSISNDESKLAETRYNHTKNTLTNDVKKSSSDSTVSSSHVSLFRKKSCSSEDLHIVDEEYNETNSNNSDWKRSSKVRRSLQFPPKPSPPNKEAIVIPVTKSVAEIRRDIEARKQLVTNSFKTNQWSNLTELEGVLGVVNNGNYEEQPKHSLSSLDGGNISPTKTAGKKRQTFITVESLKEVRGRLRKLNSPVDEIIKNDDIDDGIDTEVKPTEVSPTLDIVDDIPKNSVKSYVFGMEVMLRKTKPPIIGTGSLESRSSTKSLTNGSSRSEEWYNRRKSYGFEQVGNSQNNYSSFEKSKIESSTDSGICRSSDAFPSWSKLTEKQTSNQGSPIKTSHNIVIKSFQDPDTKNSLDIEGDAVIHKGRKTVVNLTSSTVSPSWAWSSRNGESNVQEGDSKETVIKGKIANTIRSLNEKTTLESQRLSEPITISIPLQLTTKSNHTDPSNLLLKQTKTSSNTEKVDARNTTPQSGVAAYSELIFGKEAGEFPNQETKSEFDNIPWRGNRTKTLTNFFDSEFKRHSIAVDQTKYLMEKKSNGSYSFGSMKGESKDIDSNINLNAMVPCTHSEKDNFKDATDSDQEQNAQEKRHKRVEFCKTEVHFAAEPGRFNIVETDGKPPPNNLYRRRRKTTSDVPNRSGLPEIRFGDTQYEQSLLSTTENKSNEDSLSTKALVFRSSPTYLNNEKNDYEFYSTNSSSILQPPAKLSDQQDEPSQHTTELQTFVEDDTPKPRSILKNNIPKPRPYFLGEHLENQIEGHSSWGIKLKSVKSDDDSPKPQHTTQLPIETEFQKLLKSLRPAANKPPDLFELPQSAEQSSTAADNGLEVRITSSAILPDHRRASWSVSDNLRHSEESRGYSTKVNFGPRETTVVDSIKADHPEGIKSSWLVKEQSSSYDLVPRLSPITRSGAHDHQAIEGLSDPPRVTSISLRYDNTNQPTNNPTTVRPTPTSYVTRSFLNTESSGICSKVEMSTSGERTWSFSKVPSAKPMSSKISESDILSVPLQNQQSTQKDTNRLLVRDISISPSRFSRNSQSPSKESLFLERSAERNILFNENSRHLSSSPTCGTSGKVTYANIKENSDNPKVCDNLNYPSKSFTKEVFKTVNQSNAVNATKPRLEEKIDSLKKSDLKKAVSDLKHKERKLSTSSSGRDGWLNTPKEVKIRKKPEPSVRRTEPKKENKSYDRKINSAKSSQKRTVSPIYQNREIYAETKDSNDNTETESTILEELTRAADQILLAVNGYTDDDSFRASSDDEYRKRREKVTSQPLCTISELPSKKTNPNKTVSKQSTGVIKSTRSTDLRREYRSTSKTKLGKTSSNSSMESGDVKPLLSSEDRSKRRAARLLQRASSRELLFQTASSSEDIGSGSDTGSQRTKRVFRRSRINGKHGSKQDLTTAVSESRTKERVQRTSGTHDTHTAQKVKTTTENRCSRHSKNVTGSSAGERRERRPQAVVTHSTRTQKKKPETSQLETKNGITRG